MSRNENVLEDMMEDKMLVSKVEFEDQGESVPVHVKPVEKRKNTEKSGDSLLEQERFWAALAHAMGPVMVAAWVIGDGLSWLGPVLITLGIYLYFSGKSPVVKFHARQALALQLLSSFGAMLVMLALVLFLPVWIILLVVSFLAIFILVGLVLFPVVLVAYPAAWIAAMLLPFGSLVFGGIGALKVWNGHVDYRYPYLAKWLDRRVGRTNGVIEYV